jgi:hypothetical protein
VDREQPMITQILVELLTQRTKLYQEEAVTVKIHAANWMNIQTVERETYWNYLRDDVLVAE